MYVDMWTYVDEWACVCVHVDVHVYRDQSLIQRNILIFHSPY